MGNVCYTREHSGADPSFGAEVLEKDSTGQAAPRVSASPPLRATAAPFVPSASKSPPLRAEAAPFQPGVRMSPPLNASAAPFVPGSSPYLNAVYGAAPGGFSLDDAPTDVCLLDE